jgi:hypothetical protein
MFAKACVAVFACASLAQAVAVPNAAEIVVTSESAVIRDWSSTKNAQAEERVLHIGEPLPNPRSAVDIELETNDEVPRNLEVEVDTSIHSSGISRYGKGRNKAA